VIGARSDDERRWQQPELRIERLIRSILEVRRDPITCSVMKVTLTKALRERSGSGALSLFCEDRRFASSVV